MKMLFCALVTAEGFKEMKPAESGSPVFRGLTYNVPSVCCPKQYNEGWVCPDSLK